MPHYKCETCRVRLHVSGEPAELVGDLCPECGSLLKPVAELGEIVGHRAITSRDGAAAERQSGPHRRIADLLVTRRASMPERHHLEAERCFDDADEPAAVAIALPVPRAHR